MALGEVFGEEQGQAETLFSMHRAATSNGEIGRVRQTISEATLVRPGSLEWKGAGGFGQLMCGAGKGGHGHGGGRRRDALFFFVNFVRLRTYDWRG